MGERKAKEFLDRIYEATAAKDIFLVKHEIFRAGDRGELSRRQERELLAVAEDRLAKIDIGKENPPPVFDERR
jgi:hypothetical protein